MNTIEPKVIGDNLVYKTGNKKDKIFNFQKFKTVIYFGGKNYNGIFTLSGFIMHYYAYYLSKPSIYHT